MNDNFELTIYAGSKGIDRVSDNVDVEIKLASGEIYTATFFTLDNLKKIFEKNRNTGECANGIYFWAVDMIIVPTLSERVMNETISDLIATDELRLICTKHLVDTENQ